MKPTETPTKTEPQKSADVNEAAEPQTDAKATAAIAEPPKNLEFTEVTSDDNPSPVVAAAVKPIGEEAADSEASLPASPKTAKTKPPGPTSSSGGPIFAIGLAFVVFVALAAAALYAYTKSK